METFYKCVRVLGIFFFTSVAFSQAVIGDWSAFAVAVLVVLYIATYRGTQEGEGNG